MDPGALHPLQACTYDSYAAEQSCTTSKGSATSSKYSELCEVQLLSFEHPQLYFFAEYFFLAHNVSKIFVIKCVWRLYVVSVCVFQSLSHLTSPIFHAIYRSKVVRFALYFLTASCLFISLYLLSFSWL